VARGLAAARGVTTRGEAVVLAAGLAVFASLSVTSLRRQAATYDEGAHLPAGYTYLVTGDHRLNPEHPPLAKLIAAVPLLVTGDVSFDRQDHAWATGRQWEFGRRFLYAWNDADRLLLRGRLPIVVLAAGLCAAVALWARARFGPVAGMGALILAVFSPEVLAHGQLVTTDLAIALFFFLSVISWDAFLRRSTPLRLALAALALGAAIATKFSGVVLFPVLAVLGAVAVVAGEQKGRGRRVAASFLGMSLMAWGLLWASYGFARPLSREPSVRAELLASTLAAPDHGLVTRLALAVEGAHLLPEAYTRGFLFAYRHAEKRPTFLLGKVHDDGSPLFFPVSFALKTPVPLMLLVLLALAWRKGAAGFRDEAVLWIPVAGYLLLTQSRSLNIGHRHLLPIHPFLFVVAAVAAGRLWSAAGRGRRIVLGGLGAWYVAGTLLVHPHYLSYFNEIAGGPSRGYHSLVDSSLDWGQDLEGLRDELAARGLSRVKLSYFGSADPAYYGIDAEMLPSTMSPRPARVTREVRPGDVLAVSATNLQGVYLEEDDRRLMARVRRLPVLGRVGYSIFLFRSDFTWPDR